MLQHENNNDMECESFEKVDYDVLSEDDETGETIWCRIM